MLNKTVQRCFSLNPNPDKNERTLRVKKIPAGTVIDHVPRGKGLEVLQFLGINESFDGVVTLLMNVSSASIGRKDVIKIEHKVLAKKDLDKIALIAPNATINVIKDFEVVEKYKVKTPNELVDSVRCPNPTCLSQREGVPRLLVEEKTPLKIRCAYCERVYGAKDLKY